jgi:hypothetical protein
VPQPSDAPGPGDSGIRTRRLFVPLRDGAGGVSVSLRLFRDRAEARCAVGFTTAELLESVLGTGHRRYRMTERALRDLARARGVSRLIVDPGLAAVPVAVAHYPIGCVRCRPPLRCGADPPRAVEISGFDDPSGAPAGAHRGTIRLVARA